MTDFLLWLYYTFVRINKIVNKKYFCARLKNIIYLFSVYSLYRLLILHAPPLASPPGGGVSEADERWHPSPPSSLSCAKGGGRAQQGRRDCHPNCFPARGKGVPVRKPGG